MSRTVTECAEDGCDNQAVNSEYCKEHECATGGCSMPSNTGDGTRYCSTHECAADGCTTQAFGNELFCVPHQD